MRFTKFFLSLVFLFLNLLAVAQDAKYVWAQRFGGNLNDYCWSVCDQPGNVYRIMAGVAKHNSAGVQQWTLTTAYQVQDISFDAAGDLYLTGIFTGTVDLDHGAGTSTVAAMGGYDLAIVKLSASTGNFVWGGVIGGTGNDYDAAIHTDASGNTYLSATFTGAYDVDPGSGVQNFNAASTDFFISKINSSGVLQWAKHYPCTNSGYISDIDVDANSDIYFSCSFSGSTDFDPGTAVNTFFTSSATVNDIVLSKLDASGNFLWANQIGAAGADNAYFLELGSNGKFYCSGNFVGLVDFDAGPGTLSVNSGTASNAFLAEFNTSGTPTWVKTFADYYIGGMAVDNNNGICITGPFVSADFDPGAGTFTMTSNGGSWPDTYISKFSSAGDFVWAKQIGGINNDDVSSLSIDANNNIHLAGRFKTTCDFDPNGGSVVLTAAGGNLNYDGYMLKLCQTPGVFVLQGTTSFCVGETGTYSINVLPDALTYTWILPTDWTGTSTTNTIAVTPGATGGTVTVNALNSCGATTRKLQVTVDVCAGIEEQALNKVSFYPNPSNGTVFFETTESSEVRVYGQLGQLLQATEFSPGKNTLDLSAFEKGIYFVQLSGGDEKQIVKVILQ